MPLLEDEYSSNLEGILPYPEWFEYWLATEFNRMPYNKLVDDPFEENIILIQSPSRYAAINTDNQLYAYFRHGVIRPVITINDDPTSLYNLAKCYHGIVVPLGDATANNLHCLRYNVRRLKYADGAFDGNGNCTTSASNEETTTEVQQDTTTTTTTTTTTAADEESTTTTEPTTTAADEETTTTTEPTAAEENSEAGA